MSCGEHIGKSQGARAFFTSSLNWCIGIVSKAHRETGRDWNAE